MVLNETQQPDDVPEPGQEPEPAPRGRSKAKKAKKSKRGRKDSQPVPARVPSRREEPAVPGGDNTALAEMVRKLQSQVKLLSKAKKRSRRDSSSESEVEDENEECPVLVEETVDIKDDSCTVLDWETRTKFLTPNADPATWWKRSMGSAKLRRVSPMRSSTLWTAHIMPGRVSSMTLKTMHDSGKQLLPKHFSGRNSSIEFDDSKKALTIQNNREGTICVPTHQWESPATLQEAIGAVKNYSTAVHMLRPYSYEALALERGLHEVRYFGGPASANSLQVKAREKLQLELVLSLFKIVLAHNAGQARQGLHPATYPKVVELAREVLAERNLSPDTLLTHSDGYSVTHGYVIPKHAAGEAPAPPTQQGGGGGRGGRGGSRGGGRGRGGSNGYSKGNQAHKIRATLCWQFNGGKCIPGWIDSTT